MSGTTDRDRQARITCRLLPVELVTAAANTFVSTTIRGLAITLQ